jgi:hypothetical protein
MEINDELDLIEKTLASQGGRIDALVAAVAGMLQAAKGSPEVAKAVFAKLEQHHSDHLAKAVDANYLQSFELTRNYLLSMVA